MTTDADGTEEDLSWLLAWYRCCCNGMWEHTHGLRLERYQRPSREGWTRQRDCGLPVPGWQLTIELAGVPVPVPAPRTLLVDATDGGWLTCSLTRDRFVGAGDADRVEQIVGVFRRWIEPRRSEASTIRPLQLVAHLA